MILEAIFTLLFGLINIILGLLPKFPSLADSDIASLNSALDTIFDNATLLGFFFPINLAKNLLKIVIVIVSAYHVYKLALWVITWIKSHD